MLLGLFPAQDLSARTPPVPTGGRLREILEEKDPENIIVGATTGSWAFGHNVGTILDREFSYVTPENDFKQWNIHPDPNTWNWTKTDAWIAHIAEKNQILRMHCPISPQCSHWAQTDSRTAEELEPVMRDFMQAVCERYNNSPGVISLDVVNEVVVNGNWKPDESGTGGWEVPWIKIGRDSDANQTPLYIRYAFEVAKQYAPDLKFIFNHHEHPEQTNSWNLIKTTIAYLRNLGLRVDGIGWQAHVENGWAGEQNLNHLKNLIDWAHNNDLEFHVTEASVWVDGTQNDAAFQQQADTYSDILKALVEKSVTGKVGWNTWHIDDGSGWQKERVPSLFDTNYEAKPAYYAIQQVLEELPMSTKAANPGLSNPDKDLMSEGNFPNPFFESTTIRYSLQKDSRVTIDICGLNGRKVISLVDENRGSGNYSITWDGKDSFGHPVAAGIYSYTVRTEDLSVTREMRLLR